MTTLRLLKFDAQEFATQTKSRTAETERAYIEGCPEQLWIYRLAASRYWWVRYYLDGKVYRKSTKQVGKREAISFAKSYYDTITTQGLNANLQSSATNFRVLGESAAVSERAKLQRNELTKMTYDNFVYRYQKSVLPYFGEMDVKNINYQVLENYVNKLSDVRGEMNIDMLQSKRKRRQRGE